ncbi:hypothetical protein PYCCODRAFT_1463008 [Trametes coccinea BRFM310]|uniref:DUF6534 domain-containing protein n=1 Tax=Trametes coccinea (strain BRFM310) TaxID=1353009 RepID=A0A1Y2J4D2_TRAC3|nr:hypothetical protein PYCCODRAFT_1463008 [Trametes coccinea BRFM310]
MSSPADPTSSPSTDSPVSLATTLGPFFIGTIVGLVLYGMSLQQTIQYFRSYPNDSYLFKVWVSAIILLESLHTILSVHPCYYYLVTNYDNPSELIKNIWSINTGAMVLSQAFYARRIYMLNRRYGLVILVITSLLMAAELGFSIAAAVKPFQNTYTFQFAKFAWLITAINGCAIPTDLILTGALIFILLRGKTGFKRSDSIIATLILYVINTGMLTGLIAITTLILSLVYPSLYYYIGLTLCGTKVYSNSFLAMLNSRQVLSNRMVDQFDRGNTYPMRSFQSHSQGDSRMLRSSQAPTDIPKQVSIKVETSSSVARDITMPHSDSQEEVSEHKGTLWIA